MRLAEYLGAKTGQAPGEYLKFYLRRLYGCTPSELAEQKGEFFFEMLCDLKCESWERRTAHFRQSLH